MDKRANNTDGTKVGPLTIIDFILAWVLAYQVIKGGIVFSFNSNWNFTGFQSLVLSFAAAMVFVVLMFMPVIGLLMRGAFSVVYTGVICTIIPFSRWVNDSMLWLVPIYIIVFVFCFAMHGVSDLDLVPFEMFSEKREKSHIKKANKKAEKLARKKANEQHWRKVSAEEFEQIAEREYEQQRRRQAEQAAAEQRKRQYEIEHAKTGDFRDMVTDPWNHTFCYIVAKESDVVIKNSYGGSGSINGRLFQSHDLTVETIKGDFIENLYLKGEDFKGFSDKINYLKEKYNLNTCSRFSNLATAQEWKVYIENTQNEGTSDYDYQRRQQEQRAYEQQRRQQEEQERKQQEQQSRSQDNDYDESLFAGCNDLESLKKRYRELMKIYHTDNPHGDLQKTQCIQNTYDRLAAMYN